MSVSTRFNPSITASGNDIALNAENTNTISNDLFETNYLYQDEFVYYDEGDDGITPVEPQGEAQLLPTQLQ